MHAIRSHRGFRLLALVLAALLLGACHRTVFEQPPVESSACDPALAGRWVSQGDRPGEAGELVALIAPDCRLQTIERRADGEHRSQVTTLQLGRVGNVRYLWLDAGWVHRNFEVETNLLDRPGDIYLYAFRLDADRLRLSAPAHRTLARLVLDKDVAGEVLMHDDNLTVRVTGDSEKIRRALRKHRVFRFDEPLRFLRADEAGTP